MRRAHLVADRYPSLPQQGAFGLTGRLPGPGLLPLNSCKNVSQPRYFFSGLGSPSPTLPLPCSFRDQVPSSTNEPGSRSATAAGVRTRQPEIPLLTSAIVATPGHVAQRLPAASVPAVTVRHRAIGNPRRCSGVSLLPTPLRSGALTPASPQTPEPTSSVRTIWPNSRPRNKKE